MGLRPKNAPVNEYTHTKPPGGKPPLYERLPARGLLIGAIFLTILVVSVSIGAMMGRWAAHHDMPQNTVDVDLLAETGSDIGFGDSVFGVGGPLEPPAGDSVSPDSAPVFGPELPAPDLKRYQYTFTSNDNLYNALKCFNVPHDLIMTWCGLAREKYDLSLLRPGQSFCLYADSTEEFVRFEFNISRREQLVIVRDGDAYVASRAAVEAPPDSSVSADSIPVPAWVSPDDGRHYYRGVVESNFYDSALRAGMTASKAMALIHLFGGVNFGRDIKDGDRFSAVVGPGEKAGGEGPLLAGMIETRGKPHFVFRFEDKGRAGYFDESGNSTSHGSFICPVHYKRISSGYSLSRYHPILHQRRPHFGIDYAAPTGTPVKAAAGGKVVYVGMRRGFGRTVMIEHESGFKTQYGHLNGYGKGIKKGSRVKQGQVIGYVGSSGLATGPHLDYRVYKNGKPLNPLKVTSMPGPPVKDQNGFKLAKKDLYNELERPLPMGPPRPWPGPESDAVAAAAANPADSN